MRVCSRVSLTYSRSRRARSLSSVFACAVVSVQVSKRVGRKGPHATPRTLHASAVLGDV